MLGIGSVLDLLFEPGSVFEIRAITDQGISSGYYDNPEKAESDVILLDVDKSTNGIYVTLNTVNPDLLARRANRIKTRLSKKDATTADADIIRRRWFPIDIDPVRPSGVSSSEPEHTAALEKAEAIREYLSELGWPDPISADSGNGAHLLYRVDLSNDERSRTLIKEGLNALSVIFSDSRCQVDTANFNAARIWKLYGTVSRKGDNTENRSHRRAAVTETPPEICAVTEDLLESLAGCLPKEDPAKEEPAKKSTRKRSDQPIDLGTWLDTHGLGYEQKPYADGTIFILDECPFSSAHKDGAFAIQFASGGIFAGCHHNSCGSGSQRWSELREIYEGKRTGTKKPGAGGAGGTTYNKKSDKKAILEGARSTPTEEENRIAAEADLILESGDPIRYITDTFAEDHIGDQVVAQCFALSFASRFAVNSVGLHVSISGESGKGKSHAMSSMCNLLPQELASTNRMSDKALFYKTDLRPGSAICLDDQGLSEQMQEILKGVTTSFQNEFRYDTVNKDRAGQTLIIPERCVWWVAKVEGVGDDQVWNRMLSCWIDDSLEQDCAVMENALRNAATLPQHSQGDRERVLICREIWKRLKSVYVVIPYAERIRFSDARNRRNVDMLLDIIHARAAMMQKQRSVIEHAGYLCVAATEEDFQVAADLYGDLTGESGGQLTKMTRKEADIVSQIVKLNRKEFTTHDIQAISGITNSVVNKILQGYQSRGNIYSGLLEKCPAISYCDRTNTTGDEYEKTSRRARAYQWDMDVYKDWAGIGRVWLEPESNDEDDHLRKTPSSAAFRSNSADATEQDTDSNDKSNNNSKIFNSICGKSDLEASKNVQVQEQNVTPALPVSADTISEPVKPLENSQNDKPGKNPLCGNAAEKDQVSADRISDPVKPSNNSLNKNSNNNPLPQIDPQQQPRFEVEPDDYKKLDPAIRGPCDLCGSRVVDYIEKVTEDRRKNRNNLPARRICKKCLEKARKKKSQSFRSLPGALNVAGMSRVYVDLGRCMICNSAKATWKDPDNQSCICDSCYANAGGDLSSEGDLCRSY